MHLKLHLDFRSAGASPLLLHAIACLTHLILLSLIAQRLLEDRPSNLRCQNTRSLASAGVSALTPDTTETSQQKWKCEAIAPWYRTPFALTGPTERLGTKR